MTLKGCPYMGASLYRWYPGYVGHHHCGAGGAEPLQGLAGLLCSEAPTPSAPGECLLPGRSGCPEGSPELALFLQGVSPPSCSGATVGASGAQACTQLCAGVCAPAHTQQRHVSPVVVIPDLVQGGDVAWVGERVSSAGSRGPWGPRGSPAVRGLGCLCSAECQQWPPPICPHARPRATCVPRSNLFPGPGCQAVAWSVVLEHCSAQVGEPSKVATG